MLFRLGFWDCKITIVGLCLEMRVGDHDEDGLRICWLRYSFWTMRDLTCWCHDHFTYRTKRKKKRLLRRKNEKIRARKLVDLFSCWQSKSTCNLALVSISHSFPNAFGQQGKMSSGWNNDCFASRSNTSSSPPLLCQRSALHRYT